MRPVTVYVIAIPLPQPALHFTFNPANRTCADLHAPRKAALGLHLVDRPLSLLRNDATEAARNCARAIRSADRRRHLPARASKESDAGDADGIYALFSDESKKLLDRDRFVAQLTAARGRAKTSGTRQRLNWRLEVAGSLAC